MKVSSFAVLLVVIFVSGCTYHGDMKADIFQPEQPSQPLHIKAQMICDISLEGTYTSSDLFKGHNAEISLKGSLRNAFKIAMSEVFKEVEIIDNATQVDPQNYQVILIPKLEGRSMEIFTKVTTKDAQTDDLIDKYEASGNVPYETPGAVYALAIFNVIPCALLCSPIVTPAITNMVGEEFKADFEKRIVENLQNIVREMKADRKLKAKYVNIKPSMSASTN